MKEKFRQMMETSAKQSNSSSSLSYWIGSAVVSLGGGGYVAYRLWEMGHTIGAVLAGIVFLLVGIYDLRMVLHKKIATRKRR